MGVGVAAIWVVCDRVGADETASSCGAGSPSPEIEGEAGERGGSGVAQGGEVAHAMEAVGALESAEEGLDRPTLQGESVIVLDLFRPERLVAPGSAHDAAGNAVRLEMISHASGKDLRGIDHT